MAKLRMADMGAWVNEKKSRQRAVLLGSIQELTRLTNLTRAKGGRMPVVTGTLRGSFVNSANGAEMGTADPAIYGLMSAQAIGDGDFETVTFGWTAIYALRVNSGFFGEDSLGRTYNQNGAHYVEFGTDQWKRIVAKEAAKAEASVRSRM